MMCAWRVFSTTLALCLAACGSSNSSSPPSEVVTSSTINQPTVINLYPHESAGGTDPLITVMVSSVGNVPVSMPLGFDTGSSGVTLYAQSIFPASMVNDSGFVFPAGETSLSYNGITVTNVQGTRTYGNESTLVETGNLGFATVTFGDSAGQITTQVMPVFFFYSLSYTSADIGSGYFPPMWQGWFGVAGTRQPINVAGSVAPAGGFGGCTQQTTTTCLMVSPLKFIDYGNQVNAGFSLSPSPTLPICDISTSGSCAPQPLLTVGLNSQTESGFNTTPMTCPPEGYTGPADIAGYPVCDKGIDNTTVTASGASTGSYMNSAIFDTGTPDMHFSTPTGSSFPAIVLPGTTITITTPSGFDFSYTAGTGTTNTVVAPGGGGNTIIGVEYFMAHSFMIDFTSSIEGWK
jgi:hypothetical protein